MEVTLTTRDVLLWWFTCWVQNYTCLLGHQSILTALGAKHLMAIKINTHIWKFAYFWHTDSEHTLADSCTNLWRAKCSLHPHLRCEWGQGREGSTGENDASNTLIHQILHAETRWETPVAQNVAYKTERNMWDQNNLTQLVGALLNDSTKGSTVGSDVILVRCHSVDEHKNGISIYFAHCFNIVLMGWNCITEQPVLNWHAR